MINVKKIKEINGIKFLDDLRSVSEVMVYVKRTDTYLRISKNELAQRAEVKTIKYYLTDNIFRVKRTSMVIT